MEFLLVNVLSVIEQFGMTLAVGASTFVVIFYYLAIRDGVVDASEKRFMHAVYTVLRIGLVMVVVVHAATLLYTLSLGDRSLLADPFLHFNWTLLGAIIANAALMHLKVMPMRVAPALAGGSWYALAFVNAFPPAESASYAVLVGYWLLFVALLILFLGIVRRLVVKGTRRFNQ